MTNMPNMIAYSIMSSNFTNNAPRLIIGSGRNKTYMYPENAQDDSYWIVILDAMNPRQKVKDWVVPGQNNTTVPPGLDTYMNNPNYLFAIATQYLSTLHVPQGDFYDYLVKYGADRELQRLEQINSVLGCGNFGRVSYVLTGQCSARGGSHLPPPSYEAGSISSSYAMILMSLMPLPNGQPPYSPCNHYTFNTR
jgi:hypothetical protein